MCPALTRASAVSSATSSRSSTSSWLILSTSTFAATAASAGLPLRSATTVVPASRVSRIRRPKNDAGTTSPGSAPVTVRTSEASASTNAVP